MDISRAERARIEREAAEWMARLGADACSDEDRAHFNAWRELSPVHVAAFEAAQSAWGELAFTPRSPSRERSLDRRALLAGAGVAGVGGGFFAWGVAAARTYETKVGERRRIEIERGLVIELDALSRVTVSRGGGRVALEQGRACVTVEGRPMSAKMGGCTFAAENAVFDMECDEGGLVRMALLSGEGLLKGRRGLDAAEPLNAPMLLDGREMTLTRLDADALQQLTSWRSGRVVFDDDTLAEAIAVMNRYDTRELRLDGAAAAHLRVSGMFQVGDNGRFAETLSAILPLSVRAEGDHLRLVAIS